MGQDLFNLCNVVNRLLVGVVNRYVLDMLVLFDVLLDQLGKLNIGMVSGTIGLSFVWRLERFSLWGSSHSWARGCSVLYPL